MRVPIRNDYVTDTYLYSVVIVTEIPRDSFRAPTPTCTPLCADTCTKQSHVALSPASLWPVNTPRTRIITSQYWCSRRGSPRTTLRQAHIRPPSHSGVYSSLPCQRQSQSSIAASQPRNQLCHYRNAIEKVTLSVQIYGVLQLSMSSIRAPTLKAAAKKPHFSPRLQSRVNREQFQVSGRCALQPGYI